MEESVNFYSLVWTHWPKTESKTRKQSKEVAPTEYKSRKTPGLVLLSVVLLSVVIAVVGPRSRRSSDSRKDEEEHGLSREAEEEDFCNGVVSFCFRRAFTANPKLRRASCDPSEEEEEE